VLRYFQVAVGQAAEDLAADTWMAVISGLGRFRGDERAFQAWMFTVARHRAIDWHRQAARQPRDSIPAKRLRERPAPDDPVAQVVEASRPGRRWRWWLSCPPIRPRWWPCGSSAAWRWPRWPGSSANPQGRFGCWPIAAYGAWPNGWRRPGRWGV
jgi:Sigma-70 region 2